MAHRLTTCTFCGVGCGIYQETLGGRITGAYPSMSHPTNAGRICVRGWHVHEVASSPDRLRRPLVRRGGELVETSWEEAFDVIAERLLAIRAAHGPDALAFLNVPRCSNEESYLLQKLARAVIGTHNVDHGTGVYTHNSIEVLLDMLGVPASTNPVADLDHSDVILVDGVDLGMQLPTIAGRVLRARLAGARLIVVDARRHRIAEHADPFLQVRPGTDVFLYGAMAKVIVDRGLLNLPFLKTRVGNLPAFLEAVAQYDLLGAAERCGVPAARWGLVITLLGTATLSTGSVQALRQEQSRRLLAFSSIGQGGYILFGLGVCLTSLGSPGESSAALAAAAFVGALFHTLNHGVFKSLLFLNAGSVLHATGTQDLNKLGGLMRHLPVTAVTALIASFAIAGVPSSAASPASGASSSRPSKAARSRAGCRCACWWRSSPARSRLRSSSSSSGRCSCRARATSWPPRTRATGLTRLSATSPACWGWRWAPWRWRVMASDKSEIQMTHFVRCSPKSRQIFG
jgi:hypothetical protein